MDEGNVRTLDRNAQRRDQGEAPDDFVVCGSIANNAGALCFGGR